MDDGDCTVMDLLPSRVQSFGVERDLGSTGGVGTGDSYIFRSTSVPFQDVDVFKYVQCIESLM